jgi:hypothetical protein
VVLLLLHQPAHLPTLLLLLLLNQHMVGPVGLPSLC